MLKKFNETEAATFTVKISLPLIKNGVRRNYSTNFLSSRDENILQALNRYLSFNQTLKRFVDSSAYYDNGTYRPLLNQLRNVV